MTSCCYFFSVRTGCLIAVPLYFGFAILKSIFLAVRPIHEEPRAVITLNIVMLTISGILLLVGVTKEDRVCIITFICFNIVALVIQSVGILILYIAVVDEKLAYWVLVIILVENVIFIYMVPIGIFEFNLVKEKHLRRVESYARPDSQMHAKMRYGVHGVHHSAASVPGLGV